MCAIFVCFGKHVFCRQLIKADCLNCVQVGSCISCGFTLETAVDLLQRTVYALLSFLCCWQVSKRITRLSELCAWPQHVMSTRTMPARAVFTMCAPYHEGPECHLVCPANRRINCFMDSNPFNTSHTNLQLRLLTNSTVCIVHLC